MRVAELEAWTLSLADRVRAKQPLEDARVELKSDWPSGIAKTARQLAGHANAAAGESILWIIGLREDGVIGASRHELSNWLPQIESQFDGVAPVLLRDLIVPVGDLSVVALLFETERAPYVVKNPAGGRIALEVPWRSATGTHSARREDLLRVLVPTQQLPQCEVLKAELRSGEHSDPIKEPTGSAIWMVNVEVYVTPRSRDRVVIPHHRCAGRLQVKHMSESFPIHKIQLAPPRTQVVVGDVGGIISPPRNRSKTVDSTATELLVDGPGVMIITGTARAPFLPKPFRGGLSLSFTLRPAGSPSAVSLQFPLMPRQHPVPPDNPVHLIVHRLALGV